MSKTYRDYPDGPEFHPPDYRPKHSVHLEQEKKGVALRLKALIDKEVRLLGPLRAETPVQSQPLEIVDAPLQEHYYDRRLDILQELGEQMLYENPAA